MPTYEYACPKCGTFERFQSMKDKPLATCPSCRSKVKRLIGTGAGVLFKGSGFYQTDYRSDSYKKAAKTDAAPVSTGKDAAAKPAGTDGGASAAPAAKPAATAKAAAS